jgi:hypothetical protein
MISVISMGTHTVSLSAELILRIANLDAGTVVGAYVLNMYVVIFLWQALFLRIHLGSLSGLDCTFLPSGRKSPSDYTQSLTLDGLVDPIDVSRMSYVFLPFPHTHLF